MKKHKWDRVYRIKDALMEGVTVKTIAQVTGIDRWFLFQIQKICEIEKEILQHTIKGADAKRIAEILNISALTVRKHIANIYKRLHVNSKAQIMHLAHERKWFDN